MSNEPKSPELTPAQILALDLVSRGRTITQISRHLKATDSQVNTALKHMRRKLGALSTPHAVRLAMEAGILRPGNIRGSKL